MSKRILFILPNLTVGGTITSFTSIFEHIQNKYDISVYALSGDKNVEITFESRIIPSYWMLDMYFSVLNNQRGIKYVVAFIVKFLKRICLYLHIPLEQWCYKRASKSLTKKYDIIVAFEEGPSTKFGSYLTASKRVAWVHCDYSRMASCGHELNLYASYDRIICVSAYTANVFRNIYPSLDNKIDFIYNLLDYKRILERAHCEIEDTRYDTSTFTILSMGRFVDVKRFEYIPYIVAQLKTMGVQLNWYVIGPIGKSDLYEKFVNNIQTYHVEKMVHYLGNKQNPYPYLRRADLLVSLSSSEACPMIFNEAKILGVPVVTTNFPTAKEFISTDEGLVVPLEQMGKAIYSLCTNTEEYNNHRKRLKTKKYSSEDIYCKINNLFEGD